MNILFLDDRPQRLAWAQQEYPNALLVSTAQNAIWKLRMQDVVWDLVSLDHDLNLEAFVDVNRVDTGAEVARWISAKRPAIKHIIVHSANPVAVSYMVKLLADAGYDVEAKQAPA